MTDGMKDSKGTTIEPGEAEPVIVKKRAIDVTPLVHAIWCSVTGSKQFRNYIVNRRWADQNEDRISFMLDTCNFFSAHPDEEIEVVECPSMYGSGELTDKCLKRDADAMGRTKADFDRMMAL